MRHLVKIVFAALLLIVVSAAYAEQFGPFDYYNPPKGSLSVVERAHLSARTDEYARQGSWCAYWADLDYTLRAFPNHPRALVAMAEFLEDHRPCTGQRMKRKGGVYDASTEIETGGWREHNADFYFTKGINYRPQRAETRILYGNHLRKKGKREEALRQYREAAKLDSRSADTHYQLGMRHVNTGNLDLALVHAQLAYSLGASALELKTKLIEAKKWTDELISIR